MRRSTISASVAAALGWIAGPRVEHAPWVCYRFKSPAGGIA